jgi:membrane protein YqaA with SNARE-associated domain
MIAVLAATAVGFLSAFLPFTPAEPYLIAAAATTGVPPAALGVGAAAGQAAGKLLIFLGTRGAIRSRFLRRHLPAPDPKGRLARFLRILDRPRASAGMLLLSAVTGVPPLLAVSVYLGRGPMSAATFAGLCLLGRTIRFVAIALVPRLLGY